MEAIRVSCPKCGAEFDLTEAVQDEFLKGIKEVSREEARQSLDLEMNDLRSQLEEKDKKIKETQKIELELRRKERELNERIEALDLEFERKMDEERKKISDQTRKKIEQDYQLKLKEKETQIEGIKAELEAAKRKAEQGSQQLQGEAGELSLEEFLGQNFPYDEIEPVGKGVRGADVLQRVHAPNGQACGSIIWESKNTKNWSNGWLPKLKEDQLSAKAELAVLVSVALPEKVDHFSCLDGIWVTGFPYAIGLATALREHLIQVDQARRSMEGVDEKVDLIYRYLSGPEFKQRVEMIVTTFVEMKNELDAEKRAMERIWSKRDKGLEKVIKNVSGMYGDLQGIFGEAALPAIEMLELPEPE